MRRSVRDALVGLTILGGIVGFAGTTLWLRGLKIGANTWKVSANFADATGLAERSPVTYRGILVGSIGKIDISPKSVKATLEINKGDLQLPKPVFAKVVTSSILGGDAQVSLVSLGDKLSPNTPMPWSKECSGNGILCANDIIKGESLMSISTLTEEIEKIIQKADQQNIVSNLVDSTKQFDRTQKNLDELILQTKEEISRAEPIITNLNQATNHINSILAAIDNPKTLSDIQKTASSTRSLTEKIDDLGSDVSKIMDDKELMSAIRSVTIGLGELFNELYPQGTNGPK